MKLLYTLPFCLVTGCALVIGKYDANEYAYVNQIRTTAQVSGCSKPEVTQMYINALLLKNYSQYLPDKEQEVQLINNLYQIVDQLYAFPNHSTTYCNAKMKIIEGAAERIQEVTGSKPR